MLRSVLAGFVLLPLFVLGGCPSAPPVGDAGGTQEPIVFGEVDTSHTAVIAVLTATGKCSGTIVRLQGDVATVLTAAHCCPATNVVLTTNIDAGTPVPVIADTVSVDPCFDFDGPTKNPRLSKNDYCMFQFKVPAGTPAPSAIPVAKPGQDEVLEQGGEVEFVGYGRTAKGDHGSNTQRRHTTASVDATPVLSTRFTAQQGGKDDIGGTCQGDSGGPVLFPPDADQGSQRIVGVASLSNCTSHATYMRVSAENGPLGFIDDYLSHGKTNKACPCTTNCADLAEATFDNALAACRPLKGKAKSNCEAAARKAFSDAVFDCECSAGTCIPFTPSQQSAGLCCPSGTVSVFPDDICCPVDRFVNGVCCPAPGAQLAGTAVPAQCTCPAGATICPDGTCCDGMCATDGTCCAKPKEMINGSCFCGPVACPASNECLQCAGLSICTPPSTLQCLTCPNVNGTPFPQPVPIGYYCCGNVLNGNSVCEPAASCQECPSKEDPNVVNGECFLPGQTPAPCEM